MSWLYVKPPVHGWALGRMLPDLEGLDVTSTRRLYGRLAALTDFWLTSRRAPGHRLPFYEHGNDSGWDNSTQFDRCRVVQSADLAAYLVLQLDVLVDLAERLGDERREHWDSERTSLLDAMIDELWDGRRFVARGVADGKPDGQASMLALMALLVSDRLPTNVRDRLVASVDTYLTPVGPATEPPDSPHYEPDGYWRGPVWAPSTLLLESGLRIAGATDIADRVSKRFRSTCEHSGFAENFDARTGAGLRDLAYTWTASCYLVLAREYVKRTRS